TPRAAEIRAHAPWLDHQLRLVRPRLIVTLGRVALGYFIRGAKVTELRGKATTVEHDGRQITILPTLHPAAALRAPDLLPSLDADFGKSGDILARLGARGPGSGAAPLPGRERPADGGRGPLRRAVPEHRADHEKEQARHLGRGQPQQDA